MTEFKQATFIEYFPPKWGEQPTFTTTDPDVSDGEMAILGRIYDDER